MIRPTTCIPVTAKTKLLTLFTATYLILIKCYTLAATAIRGGLVGPLHRLWELYYPRLVFLEERVVMPHSVLTFIITFFLIFTEIKSQGQPGFPFKTHPRHVSLSVNSVVMYGLSCAAELVASGFDRTSVFVNMARLGKICSLCILVITLGSLFYF